jgi:TatA/E family protein of Tat protein translocase
MDAFLPIAWLNSPLAWVVILVIGLLLFGRRLPGVARNLGQGINEFKKGLHETPTTARLQDPEKPRKTEIDDTSV